MGHLLHADAEKLGAKCGECPFKAESHPVSGYRAGKKERLIICGESLGHTEEEKGQYFCGESGRLLDRVLEKFGIPRSECYIANACMCRPPFSTTPAQWKTAIACCQPRLERELAAIPTNTILALGGRALQSLTTHRGIFDWMGAPLRAEGINSNATVFATLHPAHCLRPDGRPYLPVLYIHAGRAWEHATGALEPFRWPRILVEPDSRAVKELSRIFKTKPHVGFDVETQGIDPLHSRVMCLAISDTKAAVSIPWDRYVARHGEVVEGIDSYEAGEQLRSLVAQILADQNICKILQNGQHDILAAESLNMPLNNYHFDALLAHATVVQGIKHDLGTMAAIEFPAERWKTEFHAATDNKGLKAFVRRDPKDLRTYNAKDAAMTLLLERPLRQRLAQTRNGEAIFEGYMDRACIAIQMRRRGVAVDTSKFAEHRVKLGRNRAQAARELQLIASKLGFGLPKVDEEWLVAKKNLIRACRMCRRLKRRLDKEESIEVKKAIRKRGRHWVKMRKEAKARWEQLISSLGAPLYNPNSTRCNNELFFKKLGVQPRRWSEKTGNPSLDEKQLVELVTSANKVVALVARTLLRYRRWAKLKSTYIDGLILDANHIVHPTWSVHGARTLRWSCKDPNLQNIPKPVIGKDKKVLRAGLRDLFCGLDSLTINSLKGDRYAARLRC